MKNNYSLEYQPLSAIQIKVFLGLFFLEVHIRKLDKGYYVEVFLGKDPLTNKKNRKTKLFSPANMNSLRDANLWEAEIITSYRTGDLDLKGNMKLSNYIDYWFETYVEANCAYQTQKRYKTFCKCIKDHLGHLPLDKIKTPIIDRFYADLNKEMITLKNGTTKRRYKDGTILKTHKLLTQALDKAVGWEMIIKNAADFATAPADDERKIQTWSIEESEKFLELIKDSKLYLPVFIAFHTGLREGEACALRWVDVKEEYLEVNHSMVQKGKKLSPEDPKTAASKSNIYLTDELKIKLKEIKTYQNILWLQSRKTINFDYVCSWCNGASSQEISKRLRHSRVSTTYDIYIHVTEDIKKSTAELFSKAVENAK